MKKSLVTGGAGFIGSHIVDVLLNMGHEVIVLDNYSTGNPGNLAHQEKNPHLHIHEVDIARHEDISPLFQNVDWVFHLAALADIVPSIQNPLAYHHSNVNGTASVLEAARKHGVKRFIYAASSSCYGIPDTYPTREDAEIRPEYPYALTKNIGEQYVMHWGKVYDLAVISLRMFNVYGPRARTTGTYGAVFGVFLAQKLSEKPYTVVGDGTQTRDFTYITDIVDAFIAAAESGLRQKIFNVGSGNTYSINRLVELLGGDAIHIPKRPGEPDCTFADISRITGELNWKPKVSFEEGVALMLQHIDNWNQAPVWTPETIGDATRDWFRYLG